MYIAKSKLDKYFIPNISLDLEAFRAVVNADDELIWIDDTKNGEDARRLFPNDTPFISAYFDFDKKKGWSNEIISYTCNKFVPNGYLSIQVSRMTCKRLEKILEVAQKLDAMLLDGYGEKIVTEKKIAKMRAKFCKEKITKNSE